MHRTYFTAIYKILAFPQILSNKKEMRQIEDLIQKFEEFQLVYKTILPVVDRRLIENLILHQQEDPSIA
jgi:hypothetical protein